MKRRRRTDGMGNADGVDGATEMILQPSGHPSRGLAKGRVAFDVSAEL